MSLLSPDYERFLKLRQNGNFKLALKLLKKLFQQEDPHAFFECILMDLSGGMGLFPKNEVSRLFGDENWNVPKPEKYHFYKSVEKEMREQFEHVKANMAAQNYELALQQIIEVAQNKSIKHPFFKIWSITWTQACKVSLSPILIQWMHEIQHAEMFFRYYIITGDVKYLIKAADQCHLKAVQNAMTHPEIPNKLKYEALYGRYLKSIGLVWSQYNDPNNNKCLGVYDRTIEAVKNGIFTWLLVKNRIQFVNELAFMVCEMLWESRHEAQDWIN